MSIPDYQTVMLPLLKLAVDQQEHSNREAVDDLARHFGLTDQERKQLLPSGRQTIFDNRVAWAGTYLRKALLLTATKRGHFKITDRGLEVLENAPTAINVKFLNQFPEFREFRAARRDTPAEESDSGKDNEDTPEEALESSYQRLRNTLAKELLEQVSQSPPSLFEKLVVELLVKMGYGGSRKDAGQAMGGSGDEGIDGIIKEDRLGLDKIYIQAKRWQGTVSRPEIQKFAGALQGQRAKKGVFITTSDFSREARDYVVRIDSNIVLIDGETLAQFMIDNNVGVTPVSTFEVKRIDSDYFTDE